MIGLSAGMFILLNGRVAGISGLLASLLSSHDPGRSEKMLFLAGLLLSPFAWSLFAAPAQVSLQAGGYSLVLAGLLVGLGTRFGSGCTSGHGVCGISRLSPRSMIAVCCFMCAGFATVYVLRHLLGE